MEIVSKEKFEQIKAGVKLAGKVSRTTASLIASCAKSTVSNDAVENMRRSFDRQQSDRNLARELKHATKTAKVTATVTVTCAVALVGGLFAAIIAD